MLVRRGVLLLVPLIAASSPAVERPLVLMVGDSTTEGVCAGCPPPPSASPAPVLVATPFWSPQAQRTALADLAVALRRTELAHGPDFYAIRLPVDASGVHLTPGGYAAAAALWLDLLPP